MPAGKETSSPKIAYVHQADGGFEIDLDPPISASRYERLRSIGLNGFDSSKSRLGFDSDRVSQIVVAPKPWNVDPETQLVDLDHGFKVINYLVKISLPNESSN